MTKIVVKESFFSLSRTLNALSDSLLNGSISDNYQAQEAGTTLAPRCSVTEKVSFPH
jgi:hypothetical protein